MASASFLSLLNAPNLIWGSGATGGRVLCSINSVSQARCPKLVTQGCRLVGCGSAVPALSISNADLAKYVDTSDEWISSRTGIRRRRIITGNETLSGLAVEAARKALEMAKVDPSDIDLILVGSSTPDDLFGGDPQIQNALGCKHNPPAYDSTAACIGFIVALVSTACHIRGGGFKNVLVLGADAISRFVNWDQRETCVLFGDAAGAVLLQSSCNLLSARSIWKIFHFHAAELSQACQMEEDGLYSFDLHSDGSGSRHLNPPFSFSDASEEVPGLTESEIDFPQKRRSYSNLKMKGNEVFRFVVRGVPPAIESAFHKAGLSGSDIDWLLATPSGESEDHRCGRDQVRNPTRESDLKFGKLRKHKRSIYTVGIR